MALQRFALWAIALVVVAMAFPLSARADGEEMPLLDDALVTYFGIARTHWGAESLPNCVINGVTVNTAYAIPYDDPNPSVAARAEQPGCRIWVDRGHWRTMGRIEACTMIVHEWGHLLGYGHVDDPNSLMAEFPGHAPLGCAALGRIGAAARASARRKRACASHGRHLRRLKTRRARTARIACISPVGHRL